MKHKEEKTEERDYREGVKLVQSFLPLKFTPENLLHLPKTDRKKKDLWAEDDLWN